MPKQSGTAESSGQPGGSLPVGTGRDTGEFEKAVYEGLFKWLYENHEAVQADGRKVWRRADCAAAVQ